MYLPNDEGITHINAYSRSRLEVGRALSNFAHAPFTCQDGWFASIEAYWYWLVSPEDTRDQLRPLHGWYAKKKGRDLGGINWPEADGSFRKGITDAITAKYNAHP